MAEKNHKRPPWQEKITPVTVDQTPGAELININGNMEPGMWFNNLVDIHGAKYTGRDATRRGYLPKGKCAVLPYSGRYGEGYILALKRTNATVSCKYFFLGV